MNRLLFLEYSWQWTKKSSLCETCRNWRVNYGYRTKQIQKRNKNGKKENKEKKKCRKKDKE